MNPVYTMGRYEESFIHIILPCCFIKECKNNFSSHRSHFNMSRKILVQKLAQKVNSKPESRTVLEALKQQRQWRVTIQM